MIENRELVVFWGFSWIGKTEFMYFLWRKNANKDNNVMYLNLELPANVMLERLAKNKAGITKYNYQIKNYTDIQIKEYEKELKRLKNIDPLKLNLYSFKENPDIRSICKTIRSGYDKWYRLFIIDNLGCIRWSSNENERFDVITRELQLLKNESNLSIILVHHLKKPLDSKKYSPWWPWAFRGSQKVVDNSTQLIEIWRDLDPENIDENKKEVKLLQYKDTIGGNQGYCSIWFEKWEYYEMLQDEMF